jgi:hypothetical protein
VNSSESVSQFESVPVRLVRLPVSGGEASFADRHISYDRPDGYPFCSDRSDLLVVLDDLIIGIDAYDYTFQSLEFYTNPAQWKLALDTPRATETAALQFDTPEGDMLSYEAEIKVHYNARD